MEQAIKKAIEGGYKPKGYDLEVIGNLKKNYAWLPDETQALFLLDPKFWRCLGKSLGWAEEKFYPFDIVHATGERMPEAKWYFRNFMNHIWGGGSADDFFKDLLSAK